MATVVIAVALAVGGCATSSPDVVQRGDAQRMSQVEDGVILSVRNITIDGSQSGVGTAAGGVIGAVAGSSIGGRRDSIVGGVLGAVVGGMIGNAVERQGTREDGVELLIELKGGERRAVVQSRGNDSLYPGDKVIIVTTGSKVRVSRAP
jgi:outer membrane lipoprotein SlyB